MAGTRYGRMEVQEIIAIIIIDEGFSACASVPLRVFLIKMPSNILATTTTVIRKLKQSGYSSGNYLPEAGVCGCSRNK